MCPTKGLEPQFYQDIEDLLNASKWDWYITSSTRSLIEQDVLWKKYLAGGNKAAPPGQSAHNFGLAVDVVPDGDETKPGLQMMWDILKSTVGVKVDKPWLWLRNAVKKHPRLHSGWSFGDWPHIQKYNWQEHKGWNIK